MGAVKSYLNNFYYNAKGLFLSMLKSRFFWEALSVKMDKSEIGSNSKVFAPYSLSSVQVGDGSYIASNSKISFATIGKYCSIGPNFICGWGIHPLNGISTSPIFYSSSSPIDLKLCSADKFEERRPIIIGNDVFIGANVTVLDGVKIGDGAVIGAGAVVSKDIPAYAVAVGTPIKIIRYRFDPDIIEALQEIRWWDGDFKVLKEVEESFFDVKRFIAVRKSPNK